MNMDIIKSEGIVKREEYLSLKSNIETAIKESKGVMIFEESDIDKAGFYIKKFKGLDKKIEDVRKAIVSPLNNEVKEINSIFKNLSGMFAPELTRLDKESNDLLKDIRQRQEAQRLSEQKELEDAVLFEAEMFNDLSVIDNIPQIEFKQQKLATDNLTTQRKKTWKVIDKEKVDRKYLIIDEKMVDNLRKTYDFEVKEQPIEGIEFTFEETIRIK